MDGAVQVALQSCVKYLIRLGFARGEHGKQSGIVDSGTLTFQLGIQRIPLRMHVRNAKNTQRIRWVKQVQVFWTVKVNADVDVAVGVKADVIKGPRDRGEPVIVPLDS